MSALIARLDALKQRERLLLLVCVVAVLHVLVNMVAIPKLRGATKHVEDEISAKRQAADLLEQGLSQLQAEAARDPNAPLRQRLTELQREFSTQQAMLQGWDESLVPPREMGPLIRDMLLQQHGLQIHLIENQAPSSALPVEKNSTDPKTETTAATHTPLLYRHGIRLQVSGSYHDLVDFLVSLEKLPKRLLWAKAHLEVDEYPISTLTLQVYTLSTEKTWLEI